ncbi:hypothetical protein CARUB_v10018347mg [Capsella rubella]|uniref:Uncharacterized protein n=1 Tax=Capsella rubella TaxID=81985 RepID=R0FRY6_9BRAS|nr:hypothetical protein CARUB_v10018347mg [Capsella rubella]
MWSRLFIVEGQVDWLRIQSSVTSFIQVFASLLVFVNEEFNIVPLEGIAEVANKVVPYLISPEIKEHLRDLNSRGI